MARIGWQEISGPDFGTALRGLSGAGEAIRTAFGDANAGVDRFRNDRIRMNSNRLMGDLMSFQGSPEEFQEAVRSGRLMAGRDASMLSPEAIAAIGARAQDLQNFRLGSSNIRLADANATGREREVRHQDFNMNNLETDITANRGIRDIEVELELRGAGPNGLANRMEYLRSPEVRSRLLAAGVPPETIARLADRGVSVAQALGNLDQTYAQTDVFREQIPVLRADARGRNADAEGREIDNRYKVEDRQAVDDALRAARDIRTRYGTTEEARREMINLARRLSPRAWQLGRQELETEFGDMFGILTTPDGRPYFTENGQTVAAGTPAATAAGAAAANRPQAAPAPTAPAQEQTTTTPPAAGAAGGTATTASEAPAPSGGVRMIPTPLGPVFSPISATTGFGNQGSVPEQDVAAMIAARVADGNAGSRPGIPDGFRRAAATTGFGETPANNVRPVSAQPRENFAASEIATAAGRIARRQNNPIEGYLSQARRAESGGNDRAQNGRSSADGLYQFLDRTWAQYHRRLYGGDGLNDKFNARKQERIMREFTQDNAQALRRAGIPINNRTLYAAHHFGSGGAIQMARNPNAPVSREIVSANPQFEGMTNREALAWAGNHISGQGGNGGGRSGSDQGPNIMTAGNQNEINPLSPVSLSQSEQNPSSPENRSDPLNNPLFSPAAALRSMRESGLNLAAVPTVLPQPIMTDRPSTNVAALLAQASATRRTYA